MIRRPPRSPLFPYTTPSRSTIVVTARPAGAGPPSYAITTSVSPPPGTSSSNCSSPVLSNGGNTATCSLTINSPTAGTFAANASAVVTMGGVAVTRATGDGLSGDSGPAVKQYVDANISIWT